MRERVVGPSQVVHNFMTRSAVLVHIAIVLVLRDISLLSGLDIRSFLIRCRQIDLEVMVMLTFGKCYVMVQ